MPRYFFHQRRPLGLLLDPEGSDLSSVDAARAEAIESARELMSESLSAGWDISERSFEVVDENDQTVFILSFKEAYSTEGN